MEDPPSYDNPWPWHWLTPLPQSKIHVANGLYHFYQPDQSRLERERAPLVSVDAFVYGDGQAIAAQKDTFEFATAGRMALSSKKVRGSVAT
jgi:hypothetical protein